MKEASGKILARDNRFIWKAMPPSKILLRSGEEKVFSWFSVMHQVKNAYDILEMPTAWGNGVTCHDLRPACPSRDEKKSPITLLELLMPLLCKGLSVLGCSVCWGNAWPGGFGLEAQNAIPHMVKGHIPAASHLGRKGTGRTSTVPLPAVGAHTWLLYTGKKRADNEQEAENRVCFCSEA